MVASQGLGEGKDQNEAGVVKKSCAGASIVRKNGYSFTSVTVHMHITHRTDAGWLAGGKGWKGVKERVTLRLATGKKSMSSLPAQLYPHSRLTHSLNPLPSLEGQIKERENTLSTYTSARGREEKRENERWKEWKRGQEKRPPTGLQARTVRYSKCICMKVGGTKRTKRERGVAERWVICNWSVREFFNRDSTSSMMRVETPKEIAK